MGFTLTDQSAEFLEIDSFTKIGFIVVLRTRFRQARTGFKLIIGCSDGRIIICMPVPSETWDLVQSSEIGPIWSHHEHGTGSDIEDGTKLVPSLKMGPGPMLGMGPNWSHL